MVPLRVVVNGASGRMGREVINAVCCEEDMRMVGAVDLKTAYKSLPLTDASGEVPFSPNLEEIITGCRPDVIIDFTNAAAVMPALRTAARNGVHFVTGTTGLSAADFDEIKKLAGEGNIGVVVAANFALGAVMMMHLSKIAAKYFDYAEIIEQHHEKKLDAPSGTSLMTAEAMAQARGKPFTHSPSAGSRGKEVEGIAIHSVRLPGILARQEVILGCPGQTLSIKHDTVSRECYMPGVMIAAREVVKRKGFIYGLDSLLGL